MSTTGSKISLCMIVRNEEDVIGRCLDSVRSVADEIIVVDTGSTDRTRERALERGARVFDIPWKDDFSAARNEALQRASGDWILALDADEYLGSDAPALIRTAAARGDRSGFMMPVVNLLEEDQQTTCMMMRFFVRRPEIRYRYLIHEQVLPDLTHHARRTGKPLDRLDARIYHTGYQQQALQSRNKIERNEALFQKQLAWYPRDLYSWYKYAEFQLFAKAPLEKSLATLQKAYQLLEDLPDEKVRELPFAGEIAAYLAMLLFEQKKQVDEAYDVVARQAARSSATPHLYFIKAGIEREQKRYYEALASYQRCIELGKRPLMVPISQGITTWLALAGMGSCYLETGVLDEAERCYRASIEQCGAQIDPYSGLALIAYRRGDLTDALKWLTRLLDFQPDYQPARTTGALILERLGLTAEAAQWKEQAGNAPQTHSAVS